MSEKRTRIRLAQKLDIIEASKKSGFSIEDVMKKYGLKKSTVHRGLGWGVRDFRPEIIFFQKWFPWVPLEGIPP